MTSDDEEVNIERTIPSEDLLRVKNFRMISFPKVNFMINHRLANLSELCLEEATMHLP